MAIYNMQTFLQDTIMIVVDARILGNAEAMIYIIVDRIAQQ